MKKPTERTDDYFRYDWDRAILEGVRDGYWWGCTLTHIETGERIEFDTDSVMACLARGVELFNYNYEPDKIGY